MLKWLCPLLVLSLLYLPTAGAAPAFEEWLEQLRQEALSRGIAEDTVEKALTGLKPDPRVIKFDRKQPEFVQTFEQYLDARVTEWRIETGRRYYREHAATLKEIGNKYGIEPRYLVAFWGLESSFGRHQGTYSVVRSLATLAHDPRRSDFFRKELFAALRILDEGHVPLEEFVGGWAGAMGQNQFLPSSFLHYAQDHDGDGRKNIWSSRADVWASIANYLSRNGWERGAPWGLEVKVTEPVDFEALKPESYDTTCRALRQHTRKLEWRQWQQKGVEPLSGSPAPREKFAMIVPEAGADRFFMAGENFRTILDYNCANIYAVSVGLLADLVAEQAH